MSNAHFNRGPAYGLSAEVKNKVGGTEPNQNEPGRPHPGGGRARVRPERSRRRGGGAGPGRSGAGWGRGQDLALSLVLPREGETRAPGSPLRAGRRWAPGTPPWPGTGGGDTWQPACVCLPCRASVSPCRRPAGWGAEGAPSLRPPPPPAGSGAGSVNPGGPWVARGGGRRPRPRRAPL